MLVFVCAGGSPSLKWLFSIISRVSSGVSVRVPSGLYTESSFAFLSLQFFRIFLILADSLADSVSAKNLRHSLRLVLVGVCCMFFADTKVMPEDSVVTSSCHHEFALHVSVCVFHFWNEPWWFFNST